ncbi:MAG: MBL fold metallo-hydrolase [Candidatus Omnitrophica bacterium]|jgi:glyoxylase-like metal-dependent hydrolase (beta-lactamase superfamily II)|nr:MBL fold metallo-hydrolase [Candidatus Omnitrophota bacterium]MDD5252303.1 MBL fold metallo-hydrolase [Candidatus Omnitrophota bacterium]
MILETIIVGPMQVNCYILACAESKGAIIIDPGDEVNKIRAVLDKYHLSPAMVINTHGHYDHIGSDDQFSSSVYVHKQDVEMLKDAKKNLSALFSLPYKVTSQINLLEDKEIIKMDCLELEVLHLPGHTQGGIGLLMKKPEKGIVFTGDTLFCQGVGRYDLPGGSEQALKKSITEKLFTLPVETKVYPGHGPATTIGREKNNNCFNRID